MPSTEETLRQFRSDTIVAFANLHLEVLVLREVIFRHLPVMTADTLSEIRSEVMMSQMQDVRSAYNSSIRQTSKSSRNLVP